MSAEPHRVESHVILLACADFHPGRSNMWGSETAFNYAMNVFFPLVAVPVLMAWAPITFLFTAARQALASALPQSRWPPGLVVVISGASSGIGEVNACWRAKG